MFLDYSNIPNSSKLFLDYINNFNAVKKYYNLNFRDYNFYQDFFNKIIKNNSTPKTEVVNIIKKQYQPFAPSEKTLNNIELLKDKNTIAIFTGQQLGILGGPLYTIYKVFTAIKLSEHLNEKFNDFNFIPVFWMTGDDHDFKEISNIKIINKDNDLLTLFYNSGKGNNFNSGSIGELVFNNSIDKLKTELSKNIRTTEFNKEVSGLIDSFLVKGNTIAESFRKYLFTIFDDTGLIIFDPQDKDVKRLLRPIFRKELTDYKNHNKDILLTSADLEENYHAQVKVKPINLFLSDKTGRHLIEPVENEFRLKGKRKRISQDKMFDILDKQPERFSPNVLLRPICEEYLFPTGFYVAGPGEISYYAQTAPLYKHFSLLQPIIYPRASATIVEANIIKILLKYNLSTYDFFTGINNVKEKVLNSLSENNVETIFDNINKEIIKSLNKLTEQLSMVDVNLSNASKNSSDKILHNLEILKSKSLKSQEQKFDTVVRQLKKAGNFLYPNNNLQERELCILNFVNNYGMDFFDWLYNELDIHEFKHQILEI